MDVENLIPIIANYVGISPSTLVFYFGLLVMVAKVTGRLIPDSATGLAGAVREVAGYIAFDVSNRLQPGVSQVDVAKKVIGQMVEDKADEVIQQAAADPEALIPEVVGEVHATAKKIGL